MINDVYVLINNIWRFPIDKSLIFKNSNILYTHSKKSKASTQEIIL